MDMRRFSGKSAPWWTTQEYDLYLCPQALRQKVPGGGWGRLKSVSHPLLFSRFTFVSSFVDTSLFRSLRETLKTMPTFSILFSSYFHSKHQSKTFRNDVTLQLQDCIRVSTISPAHLRTSHCIFFLPSFLSIFLCILSTYMDLCG